VKFSEKFRREKENLLELREEKCWSAKFACLRRNQMSTNSSTSFCRTASILRLRPAIGVNIFWMCGRCRDEFIKFRTHRVEKA
jgi:hypothetical protein